jgi:hypothetical protein
MRTQLKQDFTEVVVYPHVGGPMVITVPVDIFFGFCLAGGLVRLIYDIQQFIQVSLLYPLLQYLLGSGRTCCAQLLDHNSGYSIA